MDTSRLLGPAPTAVLAAGWARRARMFARRWPGRVLIGSALVYVLARVGAPIPVALAGVAAAILVVFLLYALVQLSRALLRRLLWRIRTKLLFSYLFIAVVPVVLVTAFFLVAGLIGVFLVTSYMVGARVDAHAEELETLARTTLSAVADGGGPERFAAPLAELRAMHPGLRHALIVGGKVVSVDRVDATGRPAWLEGPGFAGGVRTAKEDVLRGLWTRGDSILILDVPLEADLFADIERSTGLRIVPHERAAGDAGPTTLTASAEAPGTVTAGAAVPLRRWDTGKSEIEAFGVRVQLRQLIERLSPAPIRTRAPDFLTGALAGLGLLFLLLYSGALVVGLILARSITRSVHALSRGTERLRQGDFSHAIPVRSRDQLGELAESFNAMSRDIQQLLRESAEKQRLEEELRIARQIQMSLLPQDTVTVPGVRVAALCLPAAEVGGDYYDLLPLSDTRMGVLVADVSGKGTSAALYMAELKGLVLSLSRIYDSPARLLAEANRILAANMDARSFITMTYAVVDTAARRLRFARAGHNPIIHLDRGSGRTRVLAPRGMGLGLDAGGRFEEVLEETEAPLRSGDVFVLFTDGLPEAMNDKAELFGEGRLRDLIEKSDGLGTEQMKDAILAGIRGFVGGAAPHDDMTLVVLEVA